MDNLIVLNLNDGSFAQGFSATLQIGDCGNYLSLVEAKLPANPILLEAYKDWQNIFRTYRYEKDTVKESPSVDERHLVEEKAKFLREHLNSWLNSELFIPVKDKLTEVFTSSEKVRVLVQTNDYDLWRIPWQEWGLFHNYPQIEIALSSPTFKSIKRGRLAAKNEIRILYVEGNIRNIETKVDIEFLKKSFKDKADIEYLKQPKRKDLSKCLRHEKGWDIIFFAGHSRTDVQQTGRLDINEQESLTIPELKYALRTAIALGLKLAIFNSCDGLGLARDIADLQIPSVVVMREPVLDEVAQNFVKKFLENFAENKTLYASVRQARESLKTLEKDYPCASWLPVICQNPADKLITCDELLQEANTETNWEGCCRTLLTIDALKRLNSNMLTQKKGLDIDDIYVSPNLGLIKRFKDKDSAQLSEQEKEQQKLEDGFPDTYKQEDFLIKVLQRGRSHYSQGRRIAIIGEAGTGKSLFLQRIGEWILWESDITNQLVIWVSLADLRKGQNLEDYLITNWLTNAKQQVNIPWTTQESLVTEFTSGRVMLLLDGADEMPIRSGNPLAEITRQIADSEWISQARIVLTCRVNVWEANQAILQNFDVYRNLEFSYQAKYGRIIDQVEAFIDKWFAGTDEQKKTGKALRQALEQEGKQQIKDLAKNPLRLSLLCLVWGEGGNLPDTKAELYQQFVQEIYKWKQTRLPVDDVKQKKLNEKLAELAKRTLDLRQQNFVKYLLTRLQEEGQTLLSKSLLADMAQGGAEPQESPFRIPHFLAWSILASDLDLALNLGWLTPVGVSKNNPQARIYTFFHPIFHEYFAAQAIGFKEWNYFLTHDNSFTSHPAYGTYRVFEQQWREVILLWFGRPSDEVPDWCKERFIQTLWQFEDGCKSFYSFQAKFLAAAALAEFRNCNYELAEIVIDKVIESSFAYYINDIENSDPLNAERTRAYAALSQTNGSKILKSLVNLLSKIPLDHIGTRSDIADAIAQFAPGYQEAINTHLDLMQIDTNSIEAIKISFNSMDRLGEIAHGNREVIKQLKQLLYKSNDSDKRKRFAATLGIIDTGKMAEKAIDTLIEEIYAASNHNDVLFYPEYFEEIALKNLDINVTNKVIEKLNYLLETIEYRSLPWHQESKIPWYENLRYCDSYGFARYQHIRLCAGIALFKINPDSTDAVSTLVNLLETNPELNPLIEYADAEHIYRVAAERLEKFGTDNETVIKALSECIVTTENKNALWWAANILEKVAAGTDKEAAISALSSKLQQSPDCKEKIAGSLAKVNPGNQEAMEALTELMQLTIENTQNGFAVSEAASTFGEVVVNNVSAVNTLIELQKATQESLTKFIKQLGISRENAGESLSEMLGESCENSGYYSARTEFLRQASKTHGLLLSTIEDLGEIARNNRKAVDCLTNLLDSPEEQIRLKAALNLAKIDPGNYDAINTLIIIHRSGQKEYYCERARGAFQSLAKQVTEISDTQRRENLINAVIEIMQTHPNIHQRYHTAKALAQADPGNVQVVATLLDLLRNHSNIHSYDVIRALKQTLRGQQFSQIVRELKDILYDTYKNNYELFEVYYELFWYCAENMSYPEFFKAFHRQPDFFYLKPKLLLGRFVYLFVLVFFTFQHYLSSYVKYPHYILLDIFSLIRLLLGYIYTICIVLCIPLFMMILFILAIFNKKLRSDFIYILKLFWLSTAGIFYNSIPQIFRLIQIRRRRRQ